MTHQPRHRALQRSLASIALAGLYAVLPAQAQTDGPWRFSASVYGYLPSLGGSASVPVDSPGNSIDIGADQILDKLKFTFMGAFDAHNGRWGVFTDLVYIDLGDSKQQTRDFSINGRPLPAGTASDIAWDLKGLAWTQAGQYRLVSDPALTLDAIGGLRLFQLKQSFRWNISGNLGPITPPGRSGERSARLSNWDAIAGVKGRYAFGSAWSFPFYADIGTGESDFTWQLAGGVSYRFSWGELTAMMRHLAYEMKSGQVIHDISFSGPMIGATWRW
jgi:hypothetical protein